MILDTTISRLQREIRDLQGQVERLQHFTRAMRASVELVSKPTTEVPCDHCDEIMPTDELISIDPQGECEVCDTCYDKLI